MWLIFASSAYPELAPESRLGTLERLTEFTLASFNAHWGTGRFGGQNRERFDAAAIVRSFDADIVVVPESWREHDGRGILDELRGDGYCIECLEFTTLDISPRRAHHAVPGEGHWELAVCSRHPVVARREVSLGRIPGDQAGPRSALVCTVAIEGTELDIVAVHVSSRLWQFAPVRHLRALRPQLPPSDRTAVVAGDCNLWGPPVEALLPGWYRAVRGRTYPAHRPHSQIDHVLVRDDVSVQWGEVLGQTPSDHRPVRARLQVEQSPRPR
jgi:endonuclease/exonuclease/phosphatase family metal-dependent hydrolase